jgi:hypothetical protein
MDQNGANGNYLRFLLSFKGLLVRREALLLAHQRHERAQAFICRNLIDDGSEKLELSLRFCNFIKL